MASEFGDPILDVADRTDTAERRKDVFESFPVHVRMAINQPRDDCFSSQIDGARCRSGDRRHSGIWPDCRDAVARDGNRLRNSRAAIERDDFAIA